jgi:hypothetical protein
LLRNSCRIAFRSLFDHITIAAQSPGSQCGTTTQSHFDCCTISAQSLRSHCAIAAESLPNKFVIAAEPLQNRFVIAMQSLHDRSTCTATAGATIASTASPLKLSRKETKDNIMINRKYIFYTLLFISKSEGSFASHAELILV